MGVAVAKKDTSAKWLEEFKLTSGNRLGAANAGVKQAQEKAVEEFAKTGIPDKKVEDYKYTNIRLHLNDEYVLKSNAAYLKQSEVRGLLIGDYPAIVMVNGKFIKEISSLKTLPKEILVRNLFSVLKEHGSVAGATFGGLVSEQAGPMALLNSSLALDGLSIIVPDGFECPQPIQVLHISTGEEKVLFNPHNIIKVGKGASITILESYHSVNLDEKTFTNSVTEIVVEDTAKVNNYILQEEDTIACQHNLRQVSVGKEAKYNAATVTLDGAMVRNDLNIAINGENAEVQMYGLFVVKEGNHTDNHTLVEHNVPNCFSNELYKGVIQNGGTGVFNGKIYVKQDAQKTNAYQSNKNILLGDDATMNTKPQLEIYADDVKCSHGTTTGRLDENALFYLQARGLNEELARKMLLGAFARQVSDAIQDQPFREYIEQRIDAHIA